MASPNPSALQRRNVIKWIWLTVGKQGSVDLTGTLSRVLYWRKSRELTRTEGWRRRPTATYDRLAHVCWHTFGVLIIVWQERRLKWLTHVRKIPARSESRFRMYSLLKFLRVREQIPIRRKEAKMVGIVPKASGGASEAKSRPRERGLEVSSADRRLFIQTSAALLQMRKKMRLRLRVHTPSGLSRV